MFNEMEGQFSQVRDPYGYLITPNGKVYHYTDHKRLENIVNERKLWLIRRDLIHEPDEGKLAYDLAIQLMDELGKKHSIDEDDLCSLSSLLHPNEDGTIMMHSTRCPGYGGTESPYCLCMAYIISFTPQGLNNHHDCSRDRVTNRELRLEFSYHDLVELCNNDNMAMELINAGQDQRSARDELEHRVDSILSQFASGTLSKSEAAKELICSVDELRFAIFDETHAKEQECRLIAYIPYKKGDNTNHIELGLPDTSDPFTVGLNPSWGDMSLEECDEMLENAGFEKKAHMIERDDDSDRMDPAQGSEQ